MTSRWNKNMLSNLGSKRRSTMCLAFCTAGKGDHAPLNGNYDNHPVEPGLLQQITSSYQSSERMEDILDSIIFIANDGFHASHRFCPLPYIRGAAFVWPISCGWSTPIKQHSAHELSTLSLNFVFDCQFLFLCYRIYKNMHFNIRWNIHVIMTLRAFRLIFKKQKNNTINVMCGLLLLKIV